MSCFSQMSDTAARSIRCSRRMATFCPALKWRRFFLLTGTSMMWLSAYRDSSDSVWSTTKAPTKAKTTAVAPATARAPPRAAPSASSGVIGDVPIRREAHVIGKTLSDVAERATAAGLGGFLQMQRFGVALVG